jgi:hypothetical protein
MIFQLHTSYHGRHGFAIVLKEETPFLFLKKERAPAAAGAETVDIFPWEVSEGRSPPIGNPKSATCAVISEGIS